MKTENLNKFGLAMPEVLLPRDDLDLEKWAVIACDQKTQDKEYWENVQRFTENKPTTLDLIYPEVYLEGSDKATIQRKVEQIHSAMRAYCKDRLFKEPRKSCVYVERTVRGKTRRGLLACIDLEEYNWNPEGPKSKIRSTEGTVRERLPVRMEIRRGATLELPHIMLLVDDKADEIMPALAARAKQKLYESPLMFGSGSIAGWALDDEHFITEVFGAFFEKQPATPEPFYFAVGDGNHSLAAAKEIWEEYKAAHPNDKSPLCRYAMVEIENLYDKGIDFEPIHRILWRNDASAEFVLGELRQYLEKGPLKALGGKVDSAEKLGEFAREPSQNNRIACFRAGEYYTFEFENKELAIAAVQPILDSFIADKPYEMDYIHGDETLCKLVQANQNRVGVLLPPFRKDGLFETIAKTGPLPRKSFSMGEAEEKRFYIEARRLVNFPY